MTNTNPGATPEQALRELGFTDTEAGLYCELARGGPATGYRLAKAIGKAAANTYQALESLAQKGAAACDEADGKTWRATPPDELIAALKAGFDRRAAGAAQALADIRPAEGDARLYGLKTPDQVLARARAMIAAAREVVLFDLFPGPFAALQPELERAAAAGVKVAGLIYGPAATTLRVVHGAAEEAATRRLQGSHLTLVADGREHMVALLSRDGGHVVQGLWSDSPYLALVIHSGLAAEIRLSAAPPRRDAFADIAVLTLRPSGLHTLIGDPE